MSSTKSENKLPNSDPEDPWQPGTLLGGLWECNRAILRWFESQLKSQPSVGEGRTATASELSGVPAKQRRGRKKIDEDEGLLIMMAQAIDAGVVERNKPTFAVRQLPGYADMPEYNRKSYEDRLVGKFNKPEFQQKLTQQQTTQDWQAAVAQLKKSKPSS